MASTRSYRFLPVNLAQSKLPLWAFAPATRSAGPTGPVPGFTLNAKERGKNNFSASLVTTLVRAWVIASPPSDDGSYNHGSCSSLSLRGEGMQVKLFFPVP